MRTCCNYDIMHLISRKLHILLFLVLDKKEKQCVALLLDGATGNQDGAIFKIFETRLIANDYRRA